MTNREDGYVAVILKGGVRVRPLSAVTLTGARLGGFSASDKMNDQRNNREQKQQVNQSAGHVKHQKSAKPKDQ